MMKKLFSLSIAALATIGLASCTQEVAPEVSESGNSSFSIFASTPDTKTAVNEDMNGVVWSVKDSLNIFHVTDGSTTFVNDGGFAFTSDNTFNGEVSGELSSSNDWYAFYPYISKMVTPGAKTAGYATIGCASNGVQKQNGNDDMSHLAGKNLPLYGKLSGVAKDQTPSFSMNQVASVVAVKVKNTTSSPLTVTNVQFTAPDAVVGTFYVDFAGESLVCTSSGAKYVDSTATLNVIGASALAQGAEATYYLAIRPFDAAVGQNLQISVNGYKKTIDLTKAVSFVPGKIKTIGFSYDLVADVKEGNYVLMVNDGSSYYAVSSDNNGSSNRRDRVQISDYTGQDTYVTDNQKIIWTISTTEGGYTIANGSQFIKPSGNSNIAPLGETDPAVVSISKQSDGTYILSNSSRYLSMNTSYGFAWYQISTGNHNIILVPAIVETDSGTDPGTDTDSMKTYQHVFTTKPSTGSSISLSGMSWDISATNLVSYNSSNYAGVQIGTSSKTGQITLTSSNSWSYLGKSTIKEIRLWLNTGGSAVTPSVSVGGVDAISDGSAIVKNLNAGNDWTKATKVTFTPAANADTGVVVIDVVTANAGYICAIEIDCE